MSAFTDLEIEYMAGQRLGRIATIVRIRPVRVVAFGIDPGGSANARSVG